MHLLNHRNAIIPTSQDHLSHNGHTDIHKLDGQSHFGMPSFPLPR